MNKPFWAIAFKDGDTENFFREEIDYKSGDLDYGDVLTFKTKEETKDFINKNCDERAFEFYAKEINQEELDKYEQGDKNG